MTVGYRGRKLIIGNNSLLGYKCKSKPPYVREVNMVICIRVSGILREIMF